MPIRSITEKPPAFRQLVTVNAHTLHADMSAASGGADSAPESHDYFDVALATCKALTACVYAKSHGIALERVSVEVERDDTQERQGTYTLSVRLGFEGALTDSERQKLHDVLTRCPIHKLMTTATIEIRQLPL
jgi:putative redox protein